VHGIGETTNFVGMLRARMDKHVVDRVPEESAAKIAIVGTGTWVWLLEFSSDLAASFDGCAAILVAVGTSRYKA